MQWKIFFLFKNDKLQDSLVKSNPVSVSMYTSPYILNTYILNSFQKDDFFSSCSFSCFRERKFYERIETRSKNEKLLLKFHRCSIVWTNFGRISPRKSVAMFDSTTNRSRMKRRDELSFSIETRFLSFSIKPVGRVKFVADPVTRLAGTDHAHFHDNKRAVRDRYDRRATVTRT